MKVSFSLRGWVARCAALVTALVVSDGRVWAADLYLNRVSSDGGSYVHESGSIFVGTISGSGNSFVTRGDASVRHDVVLQGDVLAPARVVSAGGISLGSGVSSVAPGQSWSAVGDVSVAPGAALVLRGSEVSLGGALSLSRSLCVGEGSVLRVGAGISGDVSVARGGCLAVGGADGPLVSLSVGSLVMEPGSSLRLSLDALSGRADSIVASRGVAFNGARLVLEGVDAVSAASVKDGLRVRVTDSDVLTPPDVSAVCVGS